MRWFRPSIAAVLVASAIVAFFLNKIGGEAFMTLVTGLAVWWYKSRDSEKKE